MIKKLKNQFYFLCIVILMMPATSESRSKHRRKGKEPMLTFRWVDSNKEYHLQNPHLEEYPWFGTFDSNIFKQHSLADNEIVSYRNDKSKTVLGSILKEKIDNFLKEIKLSKRERKRKNKNESNLSKKDQLRDNKKNYTDFFILQDKDYNHKHSCGLIVLKFKEHPFVVKLFIESPKSFTNIWGKGWEPIFFFYMGGGVNRHLSGFTRLKNRAYIVQRLNQDETWSKLVDVPRKWAYLPTSCPWIDITSKNLGKLQKNHTQIPGTYALIADAIESDNTDFIYSNEGSDIAISLCNFLNMQIDPHRKNFIREKGTEKLVIIDTEHFPTMVGFKEKRTFTGYVSWYKELIFQCGKNMIFCTKSDLIKAQNSSNESFHALFFSVSDENRPDSLNAA